MLEEEYAPRRRLPPHLRPPVPDEAPFEYSIRDATEQDLPHVLEIYNHYVKNSSVTFDEKVMTLAQLRRKFAKTTERRIPFIVAENPAGQVLGFAYVYPWKEKAAYRFTVENSIYIDQEAVGQGVGKALLLPLIDLCARDGRRQMIAVIGDSAHVASINLHASCGFAMVGTLKSVGFKFGRWLDSVLMERPLGPGDATLPEAGK
jgi:phosphinothricin acetyltransferase